MGLNDWLNSKMQKLHWTDVSLVKLSAFSFALMLAKIWDPVLSLAWYWYRIVFVLAAIRPVYKVFS